MRPGPGSTFMSGTLSVEKLAMITRLRGDIQEQLEGELKIKMIVCDLMEEHPGENAVGVLLLSDSGAVAEGAFPPAPGGGEPAVDARQSKYQPDTGSTAVLVGKHRDFQQFLNKEGPLYEDEFMLDLEFNYNSETCTVHNLNLPGRLRGKGLGSAIISIIERLARNMDLQLIYAPSEHRATSFWLKNGYRFKYPVEEDFFRKNSHKPNLYVAYDLRKPIEEPGN